MSASMSESEKLRESLMRSCHKSAILRILSERNLVNEILVFSGKQALNDLPTAIDMALGAIKS